MADPGCAALANDPGRLLNLSNRAWVGVGHERLIGSAITTGELPMKVLVVVRGPSLADALPADFTGNVLADVPAPMVTFLELAPAIAPDSDGIEASNDNYISGIGMMEKSRNASRKEVWWIMLATR